MQAAFIKPGFYLAGAVNILGLLLVTQFFTRSTIGAADPAAFSDFGCLVIMLWGLAYIATAPFATRAIALPLVFALEKLAYTFNWVIWMNQHGDSVAGLRQQDFLGGSFLGGYGVIDGLFCLFFALVALSNWRRLKSV